MYRWPFVVFILAMVGAACATPRPARRAVLPTQPSAGVEQPTADDSELECRWVVPTGSSLRKKVCKSPFEWQAEHESSQELLRRPRAGPQIGH